MSDETRLADVIAPINEKTGSDKDPTLPYIGLEHLPSRGSMLLGSAPSSASISTNSVFQREDVLFGKLRPNLRKALSAPFCGYCSTDILVLRAKQGVNAKFAGWLIRSEAVGAAAERTAIGTKMPRTSWPLLKEERVFVPPYSEQSLIAHILDTLDTQIRRTEEVIAKLEHVKQGLLTDLLTRGIDENGELRPAPEEAPGLYKDSPVGPIPRSWSTCLCGDLFKLSSGKARTKADIARARVGTVPVYGGNGINGQTGDHLVASPTIVIGRVGENCGVVHRTWGEAWITDNALYATWVSPEVTVDFLYRYLDWRRLSDLQVATGQPLMTQSIIAEQVLGVPNRAEQIKISEASFRLERRLADENAALTKLQSTKLGVMDDLLTGRVRVTPLLEEAEQAAG